MRYGAMNHPVRPLGGEIERLGSLGFDYLELALDPPEGHHAHLAPQVASLKEALGARGLGIVAHLPTFVSPADLAPAVRATARAEMAASLDVAAALGARYAVVHPAMPVGMGRRLLPQVRALALEALGELAARAADRGVTLGLENMFPAYGHFFEAADLAEALGRFPALHFTLDVGHAHIEDSDRGRLTALLEACGHRLGHVHLSDNRGRHDDHLPLGEGGIDLPAVVRMLKARGYAGTMTLEVFADDPQALPRSLARIRKLVAAG
jgi:sugar phosphate isomerase/epimerase